MIDKEYYTKRIAQAGPVGLVALNFELTLDFLQNARKIYDKDMEQCRHLITRAREGIENLIQSLDFDVQVSFEFYELYKYVYGLLCDVQQSGDGKKVAKVLDEVIGIVENLTKQWRELADKTNEEPLEADEGPKIYAGLTYDKDGKAAEYIDESAGGFQA